MTRTYVFERGETVRASGPAPILYVDLIRALLDAASKLAVKENLPELQVRRILLSWELVRS